MRQLFQRKAVLVSKLVKGKDEEGAKYRDYFDFSEPLYKCASHRLLALIRAGREGIISLKSQPNQEEAIESLERFFVKGNDGCSEIVAEACKDPGVQARMAPLGTILGGLSTAEFTRWLNNQREVVSRVIREAKITLA
jgi:uncharacterized protein